MKIKIFIASFLLLTSTLSVHAQAAPAIATPAEIEQQVRARFASTPELIAIANCESKFRQFTDAGNVFYGGYGDNMVGIFQFYEQVHQAAAEDLGYDLKTVAGNLDYAQYLYEQSGTTPWDSSQSCWESTLTSQDTSVIVGESNTTTNPTSLTKEEMLEQIALIKQLIELLQTLLALQR